MDSCRYRFLCWFLQLLTWALLIVVLISHIGNNIIDDKNNTFLYLFLSVYACYLGFEFYSHTLKYIKNKGSGELIYHQMGILALT